MVQAQLATLGGRVYGMGPTPGPPALVSWLKQPRHCVAVTGDTGKPSSASSMAGCSTCSAERPAAF